MNLLKGSGKAFCSGADVVALYQLLNEGGCAWIFCTVYFEFKAFRLRYQPKNIDSCTFSFPINMFLFVCYVELKASHLPVIAYDNHKIFNRDLVDFVPRVYLILLGL